MASGAGRVVIPGGTAVWPHELDTAKALAAAGHVVEFLPRIDGRGVKSADALVDGTVWEMKAPLSGTKKSLEKVLRRAGKQSRNVIIDTARMKGVPDSTVARELSKLLPLVKSVKRIMMVTKKRTVLDIKP